MESKLDEILRTGKAPGVAGCSTGPGSGQNELIFDRPDAVKDGRIILGRMERDGKFKNPVTLAAAQTKWKAVNSRKVEKIDYGKDGHPLDKD